MPGCTALFLSALTVTLFCAAVGQTKFTVSTEQEVYRAEENTNVTMIWLLHFDTNRPPDSLLIDLMNVIRTTQIFFYNSETDTEVYPDENYRGRLHCDPRLARKGRLECLLTDVRLNDTGTYDCMIVLNRESSYKTCDLNVKAAFKKPVAETSTPVRSGRNGLYAVPALFIVAIFVLFLL
ncbi:unnamed protein product [Oreochromis niloticus]|nr:unnamed protein product [Mustela putorius furo]